MSKIIKFTNTSDTEDIFPPEPAAKNIPNWYKETESYTAGERKPSGNGSTSATIKRCMPVFDSLISGYIIKSQADVFVSQTRVEDADGNYLATIPWYEWPTFNLMEFHSIIQAPKYPARKNLHESSSFPKWINPWAIETPPGYSCLFIQPFHKESVFTILPGIVDTDTYTAPVNFPFYLNDWKFEGLIPAGTEIAQVIPFKRDDFEMEIGKIEDLQKNSKVTQKLKTKFFDSYKNQFRSAKNYK